MRKFIHSNFELELSSFKITDTSENSWFTGNYFAKYSYPFELALTTENDAIFGFISHYNSMAVETLFEGQYVHGDKIEKAVLEVEQLETGLSLSIRYGFDDFPNFTKKMAELPLEKKNVTDIYDHAGTIVPKTWPEVNYNFPQIHIDKINTEDSDVWFAFEKIINNYKAGAFLVNDVDLAEDIAYNRNIIQPLPYALYLLKAGINAAGFTLHGDILADDDMKKLLVYTDTEYYDSISQESFSIYTDYDQYDSTFPGGQDGTLPGIRLANTVNFEQPGRYRIVGTVDIMCVYGHYNFARIKYKGTVIAEKVLDNTIFYMYAYQYIWNVDVLFDTVADGQPHFLEVEFEGLHSNNLDGSVRDMFMLNINPVRLHNEEGEVIANVINRDQVDLTRCVPDMTFGDYVKALLTMKNMDIDVRGTEIWINYIEKEITTRPVIDLSMYEVKRPKQAFSKGHSYLMKFQDVQSDTYKFAEVFQNIGGISTSAFAPDEKTKEIIINALPLPLLFRNGVQSAHGFFADNSKPLFVMYNGLRAGLNLSLDASSILIPSLHERYHKAWIAARLSSRSFKWSFTDYYERLLELSVKSRVHAYGNIQLVKSIQKTEVRPDLFEVEIETELFK